ncbi:MAG: 5,10-methylenetetrahydromethanopterin reductase [Gammaproteobacteria bacterium]|jgi:5,10-methylenetetrahydromethanopterin reductase
MTQPYPELGYFVLGGHIHDPQPAVGHFKQGEELGLGTVWLSERPGSKDIGVLCGAAAAAAPKLNVGAGLIANLPARNPLITASFASTMMLLTNGRFVLGVGRGQDRFADMLGVPHSKLALIERYLDALRALWRGESVNASHDGWVLENATLGVDLEAPPPIWMGAVGDKTLEWAGANCDGVILFSCLNADAVRHSVRTVKDAAIRVGRDPSKVEVAAVAVNACDVDEEKMLNYIIRRMNTYFMWPMIDLLVAVNGWDPKSAAAVRQAVAEQTRAPAGALGDEGVSREMDDLRRMRDLYPQEWIEQCNAVGNGNDGARFVRSLFDAGADKVLLHGCPPADFRSLIEAWPAHRPNRFL